MELATGTTAVGLAALALQYAHIALEHGLAVDENIDQLSHLLIAIEYLPPSFAGIHGSAFWILYLRITARNREAKTSFGIFLKKVKKSAGVTGWLIVPVR
jgi:hypothetical protein